MNLLFDKYSQLMDAGIDVDYSDLSPITKRIDEAVSVWFYSQDKELPHVWRDHYYVCHQSAENPVNGFFHIMVTLPTKDKPDTSLEIFFPDAAEDMPALIFSNLLKDGSGEEDPDRQEIIPLDDWSKKDEVEDGYPMHAEAGSDIVNKMLNSDIMYIMFKSCISEDGDPAEVEIARLSLTPFQEKWRSVSISQ